MPYHIEKQGDEFAVVEDSGKVVGKHPTRQQAIEQQRALYANVPEASGKAMGGYITKVNIAPIGDGGPTLFFPSIKATADINDLPDAAFLHVEAGGKKDDTGRTVPRSLRHLPYKTESGAIDLPKLRNALSRLGQSNTGDTGGDRWLSTSLRDSLRAKAEKILADNTNAESARKEAQPSILDRVMTFLKEGRRNSSNDAERLQQIHDLSVMNGADCPMVFKEASGKLRWVMLSSNSYQDTDQEIIAQAALEADVERADKERNYGPLRWWHVGNPDPITRTPGDGIDIGDCDFNAMHGRMLIESGTFRDERIGEAIKEHADTLAGSIGFFHPLNQPDSEGVFSNIQRFERSLLPRARASNQLTALTVTGDQDMATMKEKYEEFKSLLGGDEALAQSVIKRAESTQKAAQEAGLAFKAKAEKKPKDEEEETPEEDAAETAADEEGEGDTPKGFEKKMTSKKEGITAKASKKAKVSKSKGRQKGGKGGGGSDDQQKAMFARLDESGERTSAKEAADFDIEVDGDEVFEAISDDIMALIDSRLAESRKETATKEAGLTAQIETLQAKLKEVEAVAKTLAGDLPRGVKDGYRASQATATLTTKEDNTPKSDPLAEWFGWVTENLGGQANGQPVQPPSA